MPRESIASKLTPAAPAALPAPARIEPPAELGERATAVWWAAVRSRKPGYFCEGHAPLLRQYAQASAEAERIEAMLAGLHPIDDIDAFAKLSRLVDMHRGRASQASVRLGIAPSASMDTRSKARLASDPELSSIERMRQRYAG
jgi:hypothetical protein